MNVLSTTVMKDWTPSLFSLDRVNLNVPFIWSVPPRTRSGNRDPQISLSLGDSSHIDRLRFDLSDSGEWLIKDEVYNRAWRLGVRVTLMGGSEGTKVVTISHRVVMMNNTRKRMLFKQVCLYI